MVTSVLLDGINSQNRVHLDNKLKTFYEEGKKQCA